MKNKKIPEKVREQFLKIWNRPILFSFILAFLLVGVVEALARHSLFGGLTFLVEEPLFYLITTVCITAPLTMTYFAPKRVFAQFAVCFVILVFGIINFVLLFTRITPFEAVDFSIIRTGISIVNVYLSTFELILCIVAILLALAGVVVVYIKSPKSPVNVKEAAIYSVATTAVAVAAVVIFTVTSVYPPSFEDTNKAYDRYGFIYCFTRSIFDRGIDEPDDYNESSVDEILQIIGSGNTRDPDSKPNIIIIQLESFMDPTAFTGVEYEYDPIPNFRALKEKGTSGELYVPSVGSGTANTEFEILTGMCLDYFGTGEYPYKTVLQTQNCETVCYNLAELGYASHAFHNHTGTFYNRNVVYRNLGFNTFTPLEYMHSYEVNPLGWAKDYVLENEIMTALESTKEQDLVFAVSVQGHGKYPEKQVEGEKLVPVISETESPAYKHQLEYYAYQMWEMDDFVGKLVATLSEYEEDCVVVLYGDHQPSIEYNEEDVSFGDKHVSEYVIWANFEIEQKDKDLEAYQLTAYVLEHVGINNGLLTKLHQNYSDNENYERSLQLLEYDMLYGNMLSYGGEHEYAPTDMKIGIRDVKVTGISKINDAYYVIGENFTKSSKVYVNTKGKAAQYISSTVMILEDYEPAEGDSFTVKQVSNDFVDLGESEPYLFSGLTEVSTEIPDVPED
ncbi:MAG: sulfatase-like hydrolase/transferase [Clostridia bacterium]|nr:sulfatase-like hydrolase/transferase [Clostridia bacterium]